MQKILYEMWELGPCEAACDKQGLVAVLAVVHPQQLKHQHMNPFSTHGLKPVCQQYCEFP